MRLQATRHIYKGKYLAAELEVIFIWSMLSLAAKRDEFVLEGGASVTAGLTLVTQNTLPRALKRSRRFLTYGHAFQSFKCVGIFANQ
jgi:hypothetical protein